MEKHPWHNHRYWELFSSYQDDPKYKETINKLISIGDRLWVACRNEDLTTCRQLAHEFMKVQDEAGELGAADTEPRAAMAHIVRIARNGEPWDILVEGEETSVEGWFRWGEIALGY